MTQKVIPFEIGLRHNWKAQKHDANDVLCRQIRARVLRNDTFLVSPDTGEKGLLYAMPDKMLKSTAPYWQTDADDGELDDEGTFLEVYLKEITDADAASLGAYCDAVEGCAFERYSNLV